MGRLLSSIRACDFAVSTGGGPFFSNRRSFPGLTFFQNILHVRLAQALGKPVVFFPQSFGPLRSPAARRSVLRLLEHPRTAGILVREPFSRAWLFSGLSAGARGKVESCPDMAFRLDPPRSDSDDPCLAGLPRPRLALTVRDWDYPEAATPAERRELKGCYLPAVRDAALEFVSRRGGGAAVVAHTRGPGDFENDRIISRRLWGLLKRSLPAERLRLVDLPDDTPPERFLELYASADVVLATRMHSAIFALLAGTAAVSVHYQPKGPGVMSMLGLEEYSLPISRPDPAALAGALGSALDAMPGLRTRLSDRIAGFRADIEDKIRAVLREVVRLP
jgi:colanic acid/amylovoran biosynthesis protein